MKTISTLTVVTTAPSKKSKLGHKAFDDFVADLDWIVKASSAVNEIVDAIDTSSKRKELLIIHYRSAARYWAGRDFTETCAKCNAFHELFNEDKWDQRIVDGKTMWSIEPAFVTNRLALLI